MSKRQLLCILGVWIIIFPFLGFPSDWHKVIGLISGLVIVIAAYNLPAPSGSSKQAASSDTFVENKQP